MFKNIRKLWVKYILLMTNISGCYKLIASLSHLEEFHVLFENCDSSNTKKTIAKKLLHLNSLGL
jgi:hypothetical protein